MVGLLSGMDNEDRSSASITQRDKDVDVGAAQAEESTGQKPSAEESQPATENTDNVDEVEHAKELKSILKQRGQYTFRKVKVDFDLIPKKIPYNEADYTVEIQIVEKEPVKIKSWAALFAAKKAEAEAEAAAIAEAEEALKKAEEVQKREALKKANKAKLKKVEDRSQSSQETDTSLSAEPNENTPAPRDSSPLRQGGTKDQTLGHIEPESSQQSITKSLPDELEEHQEPTGKSNDQTETNGNGQLTKKELPPQPEQPCEDYKLAESIVEEVLDTLVLPDDLLTNVNLGKEDLKSVCKQKHEEELSCTESLEAEGSENLQEDQTNDDLEDISTHEEASVSQLVEDSNSEESLSQALHTRSDTEEKLSDEDASVSQADDSPSKMSQSEDSSKLVELQGKKIPKKVLVTATSLVEQILSEMPVVMKTDTQVHEYGKDLILKLDEHNGTDKPLQNNEGLEPIDSKVANNTKNKYVNLETRAQRKRKEFQKSNDSKILEHVKKSLESAAPEILETAEGVLEEIEKIVVDKVGSGFNDRKL